MQILSCWNTAYPRVANVRILNVILIYTCMDNVLHNCNIFLLFYLVIMVVVIHFVLQVIAREKAAASAQQASIQHQITASGEKYALPDKLAAKNKPVNTCFLYLQLDKS